MSLDTNYELIVRAQSKTKSSFCFEHFLIGTLSDLTIVFIPPRHHTKLANSNINLDIGHHGLQWIYNVLYN